MTTTTTIRILLVDDSEHVLWGLGKLIDAEKPEMTVIGKARRVGEALAALREQQPDVVLLDIFLGEENSLDYLPDMLDAGSAQVLVLTGARDPALRRRALQLGARAVVGKEQPAQELLAAIRRAHAEPVHTRPM